MNDLAGGAILSMVFLAILAAAEIWTRWWTPNAELSRKFVHLAGGLACLAIPWLIRSPWVVLTMAAALCTLFIVGGRLKWLTCLGRVDRPTRGSEYFPVAIFLVFCLAQGRPWLFVCSVLVMVVSDSMAALIGSAYGRIRYEIENDRKSLEGSAVFGVLAFLAIQIPLLLMTDYSRASCVLSALLVATLVTGFEAISLRGSDNLFVPVGVCLTLDKIIGQPVAEAVFQNAILLALCVMLGLFSRRIRTFNVGGKIVVILFAYGCWALGGRDWAAPVLLAFLAYLALELARPVEPSHVPQARVRVMLRGLLPVVFWLILADSGDIRRVCYGPFLGSFAAVATLSLWAYLRRNVLKPQPKRPGLALAVSAPMAIVVAAPAFFFASTSWQVCVAGGLVGILACLLDEGFMKSPEEATPWGARRFALTLAAGLAVLTFQTLCPT